jgi:capsular polysaccharide biosynthesis protein
MFQSAELIIGVEGAAMTNAFLAPAHARIAMITADAARTIRYSGPSRALGQEFTFLQGEAVFDSHAQLSECDIRLDPRMLKTFLGKSRFD